MNFEKVREALTKCKTTILEYDPSIKSSRQDPATRYGLWLHSDNVDLTVHDLRHCYWMIEEVMTWPPERIEKAFRWLGFIQGVLWAHHVQTVDQLKEMNK